MVADLPEGVLRLMTLAERCYETAIGEHKKNLGAAGAKKWDPATPAGGGLSFSSIYFDGNLAYVYLGNAKNEVAKFYTDILKTLVVEGRQTFCVFCGILLFLG